MEGKRITSDFHYPGIMLGFTDSLLTGSPFDSEIDDVQEGKQLPWYLLQPEQPAMVRYFADHQFLPTGIFNAGV